MLTLAYHENNKIIHINNAQKGQVYICPDCGSELIVKKGDIMSHHFAHKNLDDCGSGGESVVHRYYKELVAGLEEIEYNGQMMKVTHSQTEKKITDGLIADVLLILDGWKSVAVEICYKHAKDREHIKKYRELGLDCYEIYVDMNEEKTDFVITGHRCLFSMNQFKEEVDREYARKYEKYEFYKTSYDEMCLFYTGEVEKHIKENEELKATVRKTTGYDISQLECIYVSCNSGEQYSFLDMNQIIDFTLYDREDIDMIGFHVKSKTDRSVFYDIEFIVDRKIVEKIKNVQSSEQDLYCLKQMAADKDCEILIHGVCDGRLKPKFHY